VEIEMIEIYSITELTVIKVIHNCAGCATLLGIGETPLGVAQSHLLSNKYNCFECLGVGPFNAYTGFIKDIGIPINIGMAIRHLAIGKLKEDFDQRRFCACGNRHLTKIASFHDVMVCELCGLLLQDFARVRFGSEKKILHENNFISFIKAQHTEAKASLRNHNIK